MIVYTSEKLAIRVAQTSAAAQKAFGLNSVGDRCLILPLLPAEFVIRITWRADMLDKFKLTWSDIMLLIAHGKYDIQGNAYVDFCTYHPVSAQGLALLRWRRFIHSGLGFLAYFPIALAVIGFPVSLTFFMYFAYFENVPENGHQSLIVAGAGILVSSLLFACGVWARSFSKRKRLPDLLQAIGGSRIAIHSIDKLSLNKQLG